MSRSFKTAVRYALSVLVWLLTPPTLAGSARQLAELMPPSTQGCDTGFRQPSVTHLMTTLQTARRHWQTVRGQSYTFTLNVFNVPQGLTRTEITVTANHQLQVRPQDGQFLSPLEQHATVPELFRSIEASIAAMSTHACLGVAATYARDGHPLSLTTQVHEPGIRDGTAFWTVTNFIRR